MWLCETLTVKEYLFLSLSVMGSKYKKDSGWYLIDCHADILIMKMLTCWCLAGVIFTMFIMLTVVNKHKVQIRLTMSLVLQTKILDKPMMTRRWRSMESQEITTGITTLNNCLKSTLYFPHKSYLTSTTEQTTLENFCCFKLSVLL